ncbi:MAG: D-2-hydroxyacid dehydrogenase [Pirellulales bacterium]|nr:D-2-hydroxyacid dehydrogenase [Pirellulales bacterium]
MNIVVLDGFASNPGDLSWAQLESLGPCTVFDRTPVEEVVPRAAGVGIILVNKVAIDRPVIEALPELRYVGVLATGYDIVDCEAARERGIVVTNVPSYGTDSVVQMTLAHLLNLTLHVGEHAQAVAQGRWAASPDFCFWDFPLVELSGLTMGIVGFGRIGRAVARVARALGMKVLACDLAKPTDPPEGVEIVELDDLFRRSDVVSLHCPLSPQTRHLVDTRRLALMKPSAMLVNTSRGPVVDERALAEALSAGRLAGAGLDVLADEPPPRDHPLVGLANCYVTPHVAWATRAARDRLMTIAVDNVRAFLAGAPRNVVNP